MRRNACITLMKELTIFNSLYLFFFHKYFEGILPSFEYHFHSLLLAFINGVCSDIPCSSVSRFEETCYLTFIAIQLTGCHEMQDLDKIN